MGRLSKDQVKGASFSFIEEEVEVPQLGGSVLLRELSVGKRSALLDGLVSDDGKVLKTMELQARTFAAACADPVFTPKEVADFLPEWPATVLDKVFSVINEKLGGVTGEEEAAEAASDFPAPE
jgi:hypothetical protein